MNSDSTIQMNKPWSSKFWTQGCFVLSTKSIQFLWIPPNVSEVSLGSAGSSHLFVGLLHVRVLVMSAEQEVLKDTNQVGYQEIDGKTGGIGRGKETRH